VYISGLEGETSVEEQTGAYNGLLQPKVSRFQIFSIYYLRVIKE